MTVAYTSKVYANLLGTWTDISSSVEGPITIKRGIPGATIIDRMAITGLMKFRLHNFAGQWSPSPAIGWVLGAPVKWVVTYGGSDYIRFYGVVDAFVLNNNILGYTTVDVTVVDWIEYMARTIFVYTGTFSGTVASCLTEMLSTLTGPAASPTTSLEAGGPTLPAAFSLVQPKTTFLTEMMRLVQNGLGYLYLINDNTHGFKLVYETSTHRDPATDTPVATFDGNMLDLTVKYGEAIINSITVPFYPVIVDITVQDFIPSQTPTGGVLRMYPDIYPPYNTITFTAYKKDFVSAHGDILSWTLYYDPGDPYSVIDQLFRYEGTSTNAAADVTGTVVVSPDSVTYTFTNHNASLYVEYYIEQVRGYGVYNGTLTTKTTSDATSIAAYGEKSITFDQKYLDDFTNSQAAADDWIARYKDPQLFVTSILYDATKTATLMSNFLACDIGSFIRIKENSASMSLDTKAYIQQESIDIGPKGQIMVRYDVLDT